MSDVITVVIVNRAKDRYWWYADSEWEGQMLQVERKHFDYRGDIAYYLCPNSHNEDVFKNVNGRTTHSENLAKLYVLEKDIKFASSLSNRALASSFLQKQILSKE